MDAARRLGGRTQSCFVVGSIRPHSKADGRLHMQCRAATLRAQEDEEIHNHGGKRRLRECVVYHPRGVQICVSQLQGGG
jgi:hypothetical protein